jgi:hypothetical protein
MGGEGRGIDAQEADAALAVWCRESFCDAVCSELVDGDFLDQAVG